MKTWLRATLIMMAVGGGFTVIALVSQKLSDFHNLPMSSIVIYALFILLGAFVMISGLLFALDPKRTRALLLALAIQIPSVSSPILAFKFFAGLEIVLLLMPLTF